MEDMVYGFTRVTKYKIYSDKTCLKHVNECIRLITKKRCINNFHEFADAKKKWKLMVVWRNSFCR